MRPPRRWRTVAPRPMPDAHRLATRTAREQRSYMRKLRRYYRWSSRDGRPKPPVPRATTFEQWRAGLLEMPVPLTKGGRG